MKTLIGHKCRCIFTLPFHEWPFPGGHPAWVIVTAVDMPMVSLASSFGGKSKWVNASIIQIIESVEAPKPAPRFPRMRLWRKPKPGEWLRE